MPDRDVSTTEARHSRLKSSITFRMRNRRPSAPRDRGVRDRREALPGNIIDHVEHSEALAARELVMDEIQRPARIGSRLDQDRPR
ncbi:hypothetical protein A3721_10075 [Sulfitobacter sp. HI0023]|nr:hypothetical protein A3721_10075 [Sulfitobacter sp. HI0023]